MHEKRREKRRAEDEEIKVRRTKRKPQNRLLRAVHISRARNRHKRRAIRDETHAYLRELRLRVEQQEQSA